MLEKDEDNNSTETAKIIAIDTLAYICSRIDVGNALDMLISISNGINPCEAISEQPCHCMRIVR